jgi:hypothetical protein
VDSPATKQCGQCGAVHPATNDHFGTDNSQADSLRKICKHCYSDNRYGDKTKAVQALRVHDKMVAKARKELAENLNNLSAGQIEKYNRIVRLDGEHRAEIQKKIQDARKAEELAQQQAAAAPSLTLVQSHFGSPILLTVDEMRDKLARAKIALGNLTDESDGPAREHVETYIARLEWTVKVHDEREAEMAKDAQDSVNESVCRRVIGRVHDQFLPLIRQATTAESKIALREKIRARKKAMLAMAKTATGLDKSGAERAVVAKAIADALEKLALMLYAGTKAELPSDSLENLQSRIDSANAAQEELERAEVERRRYWDELRESNPKQFERESKSLVLQIKGTGPFADIQRKSMQQLRRDDPQEYERRALEALKPRRVTQDVVIYVVMEGKREIFYWPDGRLVKKGEEITFDFRLRRWCLMPGPASTDLEPVTASGRQKQELIQEDDGSWHWIPEGSRGEFEQLNDGTWRQKAGSVSPWTRPEKITFQRAEPPASSAHTEFRHGKFWTLEDVQKADAAEAVNPPNLLPPLPRFAVADSLALPPLNTAADRAKDRKEPYVWRRFEQAEKERKALEAELLRGNHIQMETQ